MTYLKRLILLVLLITGFAAAQNTTQDTGYQVTGFPAYALPPTMLEVIEDKGDTLVIRHKMGDIEVPARPERIFSDSSVLEPLIMAGLVPIGSVSPYANIGNVPEQLAPFLTDMPLFPWGELNLEATLALQPDLIIVHESAETNYEQLREIAPTIVLHADPFSYQRETAQQLANIFGTAEDTSLALQAYNDAVDDACSRIRGVIGGDSLAVLEIYANSAYLIAPGYGDKDFYTPGSIAHYYLYCQLEPPANLYDLVGTQGSSELSLELLPSLQADYLLINNFDEANYQDWVSKPLWQKLPAVEAGRTYQLASSVWGLYGDLLNLQELADKVAPRSSMVCPAGFRYFEHEHLATDSTCIPETPERVTYLMYPSYLYPFGINPLGAWGLERDAANYPYIADWIREGTIDHGMPPNLETVLGLEPDLMVYDIRRVAEVTDELQAIAPLVTFDDRGTVNWQERHRFNGAVFNQSAKAEAQLEAYQQRASELRQALLAAGYNPADMTVSVVRLRGEGDIRLMGPWYTCSDVLTTIGFKLAEPVDMTIEEMQTRYGNPFNVRISAETIDWVDADKVFVIGSAGKEAVPDRDNNEIINTMLDNPLWQSLAAYKNDAMHAVQDHWTQSNILTAHMVIDDVAQVFGIELASHNPFNPQATANTQTDSSTGTTQAQSCPQGERLFTHQLLATEPVCVPETPERIAMFETVGMEFMLLLDVKPVIRTQYFDRLFRAAFHDYEAQIDALFGDLPDAGLSAPNLEVMVEANPDLIVTYDYFMDLAEQLNAIAPTVFVSLVPGQGLDLQNLANFHNELWAQDARLGDYVTAYEARATALGAAINDKINHKSVVIGRLDASDEPVVFFPGAPAYNVLYDAGWQPESAFAEKLASTVENFRFAMEPITLENLGAIDGDYLIIYDLMDNSFDPEVNSEKLDTLLANPLFKALSAVQNEQLDLTEGYWNLYGLIPQHQMIDDMWRFFTGEEPSVANPF